jgi:hypothetical protein
MKRFALTLVVLAVASAAFAGDVVKRGAAIAADAKAVSLATVLENPDPYTKDAVVVEGVIQTACERKGCWMQIAPKAGEAAVRVTFKDYGFFIPLDAKGMQVRAEGVTVVKTLSKEEADHLEGEGAKLARSADGTAKEVSFVANGVELRK